MHDVIFIKEKIKELKKQIKDYEQELVDICPHENVSPGFGKYHEPYGEYVFVCDDCGMTFITEDPNFKYKKN